MPNNDFRVRRFGDGDKVYGKDLEGLRDGVRATPIGRTFRGRTVRTPGGQIFMPYATQNISASGGLAVLKVKSGSDTSYICDVVSDTSETANVLIEDVNLFVQDAVGDLPVDSLWFCNAETDRYVPINVIRLYDET